MQNSKGHILKVLSGTQTGVEVALGPGEYSLGTGQDDDLQFVDVSLGPGHARLKIENERVFLAGGSGGAKTKSGITIAAGDEDWRQVDDLDVVTIGATAFALGSPGANWAKVVNYRDTLDSPETEHGKRLVATRKAFPEKHRNRLVWAGAIGLCILVGGSVVLAPLLGGTTQASAEAERAELELLQEAFASLPFNHDVILRQEVDGVIFANGYVDEPVERRALLNAADATGIPVRMRVFVRSLMREQIAGLIERRNLKVTFQMTDEGAVTLSGDILNPEQAERFVSRLKTDVSGISNIDNQIQTAASYLELVRQLAVRSELNNQILFRLDGPLIEASGIIGANKLDNYVGFIQSYARRFADHIPLRSLVQSVNENGEIIVTAAANDQGDPIVIGASGLAQGLDLNRLKQGFFNAADVFNNLKNDAKAEPGIWATPAKIVPALAPVADPSALTTSGITPLAGRSGQNPTSASTQANVPDQIALGVTPLAELSDETTSAVQISSASQEATDRLAGFASDLLAGGSINVDDSTGLKNIASELQKRWSNDATAGFLPLVVSPASTAEACWPNSELTVANLPITLFWLDMLSVSNEMDVTDLDIQSQDLLLEAALSPANTAACTQRLGQVQGLQLTEVSLFLNEIQQNPDFIRFIVRNVKTVQLSIAGVMVGNDDRYVQISNGLRLQEGASPDPSSKLSSVGELGALIRTSDTLFTVIYGNDIAWIAKS